MGRMGSSAREGLETIVSWRGACFVRLLSRGLLGLCLVWGAMAAHAQVQLTKAAAGEPLPQGLAQSVSGLQADVVVVNFPTNWEPHFDGEAVVLRNESGEQIALQTARFKEMGDDKSDAAEKARTLRQIRTFFLERPESDKDHLRYLSPFKSEKLGNGSTMEQAVWAPVASTGTSITVCVVAHKDRYFVLAFSVLPANADWKPRLDLLSNAVRKADWKM